MTSAWPKLKGKKICFFAPTISRSQMQCQAPLNISSCSCPTDSPYRVMGRELEDSMDYKCADYCTCSQLRTTNSSSTQWKTVLVVHRSPWMNDAAAWGAEPRAATGGSELPSTFTGRRGQFDGGTCIMLQAKRNMAQKVNLAFKCSWNKKKRKLQLHFAKY